MRTPTEVKKLEADIDAIVAEEVPKHTDLMQINDLGQKNIQTDGCVREIMERVVRGQSLKRIASDPHMPRIETLYKWIQYDPDFRLLYEQACQMRLDALAEEILDIADDTSNDIVEMVGRNGVSYKRFNPNAVDRCSLQIKTRQWMMERLNKAKYSTGTETSQNAASVHVQVLLPDNGRPVIEVEGK